MSIATIFKGENNPNVQQMSGKETTVLIYSGMLVTNKKQ